MMISVIMRHELIRKMPKILLLNLAMVTLVAGLVVNKHVDNGDGILLRDPLLIVVQLFVFLGAVGVMELPEARRRCRTWDLTLPVKGSFWWKSHFLSLILAGISMMLVYAIIPMGLALLSTKLDFMNINILKLMWDMWVLPALAFLTVVNLFVLQNKDSVTLVWSKGKHVQFVFVVFLMAFFMGLCSWFGKPLIMIAPLGMLVFLNSRQRISSNLEMSVDPNSEIEKTVWVANEASGASRWLKHHTIMRLLFKWPTNWIALIPFSAFFGLLLGGFNPITSDPDSLRFSNICMSIYVLTSSCGYFCERLYLVDPLPIDRRTILIWLVVPVVLAMGFGYGGGRIIINNSTMAESAFSLVSTDDECYFSVPARCFKTSSNEGDLEIVAPWGETHSARSMKWHEKLPWTFYNPYSIPMGSSARFAAWQIKRVVADVYGADISAEVISEKYLFEDSSGGVRVREEGMYIEKDFALNKKVSSGPVFPLVIGTVVTAFLLILAINFRALRRVVSISRSRVVFWGIMVLLLFGHIGDILKSSLLAESWIYPGFILGTMHRWSQAQAGAVPIAYGLAFLVIGLSWTLALHQFRRVESPQN